VVSPKHGLDWLLRMDSFAALGQLGPRPHIHVQPGVAFPLPDLLPQERMIMMLFTRVQLMDAGDWDDSTKRP
jgi:hypothetical protein